MNQSSSNTEQSDVVFCANKYRALLHLEHNIHSHYTVGCQKVSGKICFYLVLLATMISVHIGTGGLVD
jgi:hypothetical protein